MRGLVRSSGLVFGEKLSIGVEPTNLPDRSRYGNDGTYTSITDVQLPSGLWVRSIDGSSGMVNLGTNMSLRGKAQMTVMCWVKLTALTAAGHVLIGKEGTSITTDYEWAFFIYDNDSDDNYHLRFGVSDDGNGGSDIHRLFMESDNQIADMNWHHLAAVVDLSFRDNDDVKFFKDAVQAVSSKNTGAYVTSVYQANNSCRIGETERLSGADWTLGGQIALPDQLNYALSAGRIKQIYESERSWFGV